jgi:hypothetical protein
MDTNTLYVADAIQNPTIPKPVPVSFLNLVQDTNTDTDIVSEPIPSNPTIETQPVKCKLFTCELFTCELFTCDRSCFDQESIYYDPRCCGTYHVCCRKPTNIYYGDDSCLCCRDSTCSSDFKEQCCCNTYCHVCEFIITDNDPCVTLIWCSCKIPFLVPFLCGVAINKMLNLICSTDSENYLL